MFYILYRNSYGRGMWLLITGLDWLRICFCCVVYKYIQVISVYKSQSYKHDIILFRNIID